MLNWIARLRRTDSQPRGFLGRLRRDVRGNTLAIVGAALIPLAAMIGSGVDMSRAYMARTRLQSACDAAALAARRVLQNNQLNQSVIDEGRRFFDYNFPREAESGSGSGNNGNGNGNEGPRLYGTAPFQAQITQPTNGTIRVTADTTIPTTIMRMFGFVNLPLNVTCDASMNFVNTDIVLVLDVTGSMMCTPEEASNCGRTTEISTSRIAALREAVMALYNELAPVQQQLEANNMRLRYSVVPFSATVNAGNLLTAENANYVTSDYEYQTRVANYSTPTYVGTAGTPEAPVQQVYASSITQAQCDQYGRNVAFTGFTPSATTGGGPAPAATWSRTFSNNEASGVDWGWSGAADSSQGGSDNRMSCRRRYVETDTTYVTRYRFTSASYEPESIDVEALRNGNTVDIATNDGGSMATSGNYDPLEVAAGATNEGSGVTSLSRTSMEWNGCVLEPDTVTSITTDSGYTIPGGANDLNVNLIPSSDATRWRPQLSPITWRRSSGAGPTSSATQMSTLGAAWAPCPTESRRLQAWSQSAMQNYLNSLIAVGGTYHDVGMVWGLRMQSTGGVFADGCETFNGMPCERHIIFMTDGQLSIFNNEQGAYGLELNERRVSGNYNASNADLNARHTQRFRMLCNAAQGMDISVWVVAFATTPDSSMESCASNSNQFFSATNRAQLVQRFREMGARIGALRLTQ